MKLKIAFDCDNAAFRDESCMLEVARILRHLADRCESCCDLWDFDLTPVMDVNGNRVGKVVVSK